MKVLFLGAGASKPAGYPLSEQLLPTIAAHTCRAARSRAEWERWQAFREAQTTLWVAYYRRALPRVLKVRELLRAGAIGQLTSIHVKVTDPLVTGEAAKAWRFNTEIAGAGPIAA